MEFKKKVCVDKRKKPRRWFWKKSSPKAPYIYTICVAETSYDFMGFWALKDTLWFKNLNCVIEVGEEATKNVWNIHITTAKH